ncbi:MAG: hypothetical protein ACO29Y_05980 [Holophagaceae bacterium]
MIGKLQAILSLRPNSQFGLRNDEELEWNDPIQTQPTEAEIQAEIVRLQADYDSKQYQRDRRPEYPDLAVLADALYWSNQGDNTKLDEYYAACAAVKAKYPKPE